MVHFVSTCAAYLMCFEVECPVSNYTWIMESLWLLPSHLQVVKDRLLDLLSREDEEESHGEDVVRANPALSLPPPLTVIRSFGRMRRRELKQTASNLLAQRQTFLESYYVVFYLFNETCCSLSPICSPGVSGWMYTAARVL